MPQVFFSGYLRQILSESPVTVEASTVITAFDEVFMRHRGLKHYMFDDRGTLRKRVRIYVDGSPVRGEDHLLSRVGQASKIYVF